MLSHTFLLEIHQAGSLLNNISHAEERILSLIIVYMTAYHLPIWLSPQAQYYREANHFIRSGEGKLEIRHS